MLYKGRDLPDRFGLYLQEAPPVPPGEDQFDMSVGSLFATNEDIVGLLARLFGIQLTLLMGRVQPEVQTYLDDAHFRPEGILVMGCSKQLIFRWKGGHQSGTLVLQFVSTP